MTASTASRFRRILVVDDKDEVLEVLRLLLKAEGFETRTANSPTRALEQARKFELDAALIDPNYIRDTTSGREGLHLLEQLKELDPALLVIVMNAWGSRELAVKAMRQGARDFIQKPCDNARLITIIRTETDLAMPIRRTDRLEAENQLLRESTGPTLVDESPTMRVALELINCIGPLRQPQWLPAKMVQAKASWRAIHAVSTRRTKTLVVVNMGGFPEGVFESEMFGHVKGAFTEVRTNQVGRFEMADQGTLSLDEIANLGLVQQARLLRALYIGEFERVCSSRTHRAPVRIISATNADL